MKVLITGANGFVGRALVARLDDQPDCTAVCAVRNPKGLAAVPVKVVQIPDLTANTDWSAALSGVEVVVHTAARVHVMNEQSADPLAEFRRVNVEGTLALARQAATAGVRRFVFLSSIKVNGEATEPGKPFTADQPPAPVDPYGISKLEAEQGLQELAAETGMSVVIIRPVLVYGPGVKGNFRSMLGWLRRGIPLPLGAINNRRSLVALDNLVDLIMACTTHPAASNQVFLVSDDEDMSTTQLLQRMARAMDTSSRLIPVPAVLIKAVAALLGRGDIAQRLCGSLQVDISKTKERLQWQPPVSVDTALRRTAEECV
jgi:nucleoside-diphosphate-sugar epimerase